MDSRVQTRWACAPWLAIALAILPIAASYTRRYQLGLAAVTGIYACFLLLLSYLVASSTDSGRHFIARVIGTNYRAPKVLLALLAPYFCYALGTADFRRQPLLRLLAIAAPVVIYSLRLPLRDLIVALWLVFVVLSHFMAGIWGRPANLDFMARFWIVSLGVFCWVYLRPVSNLGFELVINRRVAVAVVKNFLIFSVLAIPLGALLHFTGWNPRWRGALDFATAFLEIFLFIALLEELFFRGFLQNLFDDLLHSRWRSQLLTSCIFGLFHILHAPFPNWRYVILASIAGWFYGAAFRESGTLLGSALVHAAVDTVWRTFFTR